MRVKIARSMLRLKGVEKPGVKSVSALADQIGGTESFEIEKMVDARG